MRIQTENILSLCNHSTYKISCCCNFWNFRDLYSYWNIRKKTLPEVCAPMENKSLAGVFERIYSEYPIVAIASTSCRQKTSMLLKNKNCTKMWRNTRLLMIQTIVIYRVQLKFQVSNQIKWTLESRTQKQTQAGRPEKRKARVMFLLCTVRPAMLDLCCATRKFRAFLNRNTTPVVLTASYRIGNLINSPTIMCGSGLKNARSTWSIAAWSLTVATTTIQS